MPRAKKCARRYGTPVVPSTLGTARAAREPRGLNITRSAAAECADNLNLVAVGELMREVAYLLAVDEELDVPPDAIVLIDYAKPNSWKPLLEAICECSERSGLQLQ